MSKTYKGQTTNSVVELTLQEEAVGAGFDTPTIAWDDTVNGVITQVQGDIPDNWANTDKVKGPLEIGTSCTTIGSSAFFLCTGLTGSLVIPDSVTSIGIGAFRICSSITALYTNTPAASWVATGALNGTTALVNIYYGPNTNNGAGYNATFQGGSGMTVSAWTNYPNIP